MLDHIPATFDPEKLEDTMSYKGLFCKIKVNIPYVYSINKILINRFDIYLSSLILLIEQKPTKKVVYVRMNSVVGLVILELSGMRSSSKPVSIRTINISIDIFLKGYILHKYLNSCLLCKDAKNDIINNK